METLQRTANSGSVSTGFNIDNSLKFERANAEAIETTNQAAGNKKTWTFSAWIKRTELSKDYHTVFGSGYTAIKLMEQDNIRVELYDGSNTRYADTANLLRDTAAFYHIVVALDSTDGTAADRVKIYINGVRVTSFSNTTYTNMTQNDEFGLGYAGSAGSERYLRLGRYFDGAEGFSGYMSDVYYLNGTAEDADAFGETDEDSGIWKPKKYTGSGFGTQGFKYEFKDSSALGTDTSGEGHDANSLNAIAAKDQATDTPTNNFCTLNPLVNFKYTTNGIFEGGTQYGNSTGGGVGGAFGTMAVTSGKWYWEVKLIQQVAHYIGVSAVDDGDNVLASSDPHQINSSFVFNISAARIEYIDGGSVTAGSADAFTDFHSTGAIMGIALNMDDNQISIYGNGTLQADVANTSLFDAANKMVVPFHATINDTVQYNFGGYSAWTPSSAVSDANGYGTFEYAPPSGYYALCTKNLAEYGG